MKHIIKNIIGDDYIDFNGNEVCACLARYLQYGINEPIQYYIIVNNKEVLVKEDDYIVKYNNGDLRTYNKDDFNKLFYKI